MKIEIEIIKTKKLTKGEYVYERKIPEQKRGEAIDVFMERIKKEIQKELK